MSTINAQQEANTASGRTNYRRIRFNVRGLLVVTLCVALLLWSVPLAYEWWTAVPTVALADAIAEFNAEAVTDSVGRYEPPLSEQEVISSIQVQLPQLAKSPNADSIYRRIVKTHRVPIDARLVHMSRYQPGNGQTRRVWWVNLEIVTGKNAGYALRIRENNSP